MSSELGGSTAGNRLARHRAARVAVGLAVAMCTAIALIACTEIVQPTSTPVVFDPTPAPAGTRDQILAGADPLTLVALAQPKELPPGNADSGEGLYTSLGCTACHTLDSETVVGPGFQGVYARAATRTELSADEYIAQSLTEPAAYLVDGFTNVMQVFDYLSDQEVADIIAFLKTVQ